VEFWSNAPILAFGTAFVKRQMNGVAVGTFVALGLGEGGINARIRADGAIMALRYGWVVAPFESVEFQISNPGDDTLRWRCKLDAKR
jgi:hypothetical protein